MDAVINNVLLFLEDNGLYATLDTLALELDKLGLASPDTKSTIRDQNDRFKVLGSDSRERLRVLANNRKLDAGRYPQLQDPSKLFKKSSPNVNDSSAQMRESLTHQLKAEPFKIKNKDPKNLPDISHDTYHHSNVKKSENTVREGLNFSFRDTPVRSHSYLAPETLQNNIINNKEGRNSQSVRNIENTSWKNSKSQTDVFSADYHPDGFDVNSIQHGTSRCYKPFYVNDGRLRSNPKIRSG